MYVKITVKFKWYPMLYIPLVFYFILTGVRGTSKKLIKLYTTIIITILHINVNTQILVI